MTRAYLMVALTVALMAGGQLLFKQVGLRVEATGWLRLHTDRAGLAFLALTLCVYALSTITWIEALRRLPLSRAYVFVALAFVLVPLGARLFYAERMGWGFYAGTALIAVGIALSAAGPTGR